MYVTKGNIGFRTYSNPGELAIGTRWYYGELDSWQAGFMASCVHFTLGSMRAGFLVSRVHFTLGSWRAGFISRWVHFTLGSWQAGFYHLLTPSSYENTKYIDGISGMYFRNVGHGREEIAKAIYDQLSNVSMNVYAGITPNQLSWLKKSHL